MESTESTHYDYVVLGAGIAGLSAAYHLSKDGHRVLVLEAGDGKNNASIASTAEMNHDPDADWERIIAQFGIEKARLVWELGAMGIELMSEFAHELREPHFSAARVPAYFYAYRSEDVELLKQRFAIYSSLGANVSFSEDPRETTLLHPHFKAVLTTHGEGVTNNQELVASLIHHAEEHGVHILHHKKATHIQGSEVTTEDGTVYSGTQIIVATGDGGGLLPERMAIKRKKTFVVSFEKHDLSELFKNSVLWDTDVPYHYVRTFAGNRLWVGGEDVDEATYAGSAHADEEKYALLEKYAKDILQVEGTYTRQAAWSGLFFPATRGLPYIGAIPDSSIIASVGFGGTGIITSFMSGYLLAAWQRGEMREYQEIFSTEWQ